MLGYIYIMVIESKICFLFQVPESELEMVNNLHLIWNDVFVEAQEVDLKLVKIKSRFSKTTQNLVARFKLKVQDFLKKYLQKGPESCTGNLDEATELYKVYLRGSLCILMQCNYDRFSKRSFIFLTWRDKI